MDLFAKRAGCGPLLFLLLSTGLYSTQAWSDDAEKQQELEQLKARVQQLEEELNAQRNGNGDRPVKAVPNWIDRIEIGGLVEVEAGVLDSPDGHESDVVLATVELAFAAQLNDWVSAHLLLLYEEDDTEPMEVDEAIISIGNPERSPFFVSLGRMVLPFGSFESHMVSDPLTLELGESHESALQFGFENNGLVVSLFVSNGDTKEEGDNEIDLFGLSMGVFHETQSGNFNVNAGLSYLNNMADSDNLQDAVFDADNLADKTGGAGGYLVVNTGPVTLIGEYLRATDSFDLRDLDFRGRGAQPVSWNLEAAYHFTLGKWNSSVALAWQGSDEALALELPERRVVAALSMEIMSSTLLSLEWANDEDYGVTDGGSGDRTNIFTAQLAVEF